MLFFDIETTADPTAIDLIEVKPPSNYKDPEKIQAYTEEAKANEISRMALDPDLGKILAISYKEDDKPTECLFDDEAKMLTTFWDLINEHAGYCCGYNIIGFDLPYITRRSMALGVKAVTGISLRKYNTYPALDLMGVLYNWDKARSLKWVCKRWNIPNPLPELNGSMVGQMDDQTLVAYAKNDVDMTYALYQKMLGVYL